MIEITKSIAAGASALSDIEHRSGVNVTDCYQCGRCTATCPCVSALDIPPHRVMRLLQLGRVDTVLASKTAHFCLDCMTCSLRCPMQVDVAAVIEAAKNVADERGMSDGPRQMRVFRQEFLKNVRRHGRLHEPSLMTSINIKTGKPLNDLSLVPFVLRKKKLHFVPPRIKNLRHLRGLFKQINRSRRRS